MLPLNSTAGTPIFQGATRFAGSSEWFLAAAALAGLSGTEENLEARNSRKDEESSSSPLPDFVSS